MAERIVPRLAAVSNGYLPAPEIERAGDTMVRQTVRDGGIDSILWMRIERLGIPMVVLAAIFFLVYSGGSWAGTNFIKPTVENMSELQHAQVRNQELIAEALRLNGQSLAQVREGLVSVSVALQIIHEDNKARLESDAKTQAMLQKLSDKISEMN